MAQAGLIDLPAGINIVEFVQHDGKPPSAATPTSASRKTLTLVTLGDGYLATSTGQAAPSAAMTPSTRSAIA